MSVDLHMHSTASDGTLAPHRLVRRAVKRGLRIIAITDHDTTAALDEALEASKVYSVEIIPGIEINTEFDGAEAHILGYFIDVHNAALQSALEGVRQARRDRIGGILEKLREHGVELTAEDVAKYAKGDSIGRPHVAQALVAKKAASHVGDAFDKWLARDRRAYVPRASMTPQHAIELIHGAGGVAFLAHPVYLPEETHIVPLIQAGLDGLEVVYPQHDALTRERFASLARANNLAMSGGSDFHGPQVKRRTELGDAGFTLADLRAMCDHLGIEAPRTAQRAKQ
jgi:predicted metal-dependent phosphoesterase TrpH